MPPVGRGGRRAIGMSDTALAQHFPQLETALAHPLDRRRVLKLLGLALAGGGVAGCDPGTPDRGFVSAVRAAEGVVPGLPNTYATAHVRDGYAEGIVVTHQMGRPIKVEGNPEHPGSLGATDVTGQALIYDFYDPDRASGPLHAGMPASWPELAGGMQEMRATGLPRRPDGTRAGTGVRILTGTITSPTVGRAIEQVLAACPGAAWHQWDAIGRENVTEGLDLAYGAPVAVLADLEQADVVLALDSDLLDSAPGHLCHARAFAARRNPVRGVMNRLYAVEPTPTLTGVAADHRFVATPAMMDGVIGRLSARLLHNEAPSGGPDWLDPVVDDLLAHHGRAFVHCGPDHPPEVQAAVQAMNAALGGRGRVFDIIESPRYQPATPTGTLSTLMDDMERGVVTALLVLDVNPVYQSTRFAAALPRVPISVALSDRPHETALAARWHVPLAHGMEDWGDARGHDGTVALIQPQAMPLYGGLNAASALRACLGQAQPRAIDLVRETWRARLPGPRDWHDALACGVIRGTASPRVDVPLRPAAMRVASPAIFPRPSAQPVLLLRPDPYLWDGRGANNPWLQELPRPLTKVVWDNPLLIPPDMARVMNLRNGDRVTLTRGAAHVQMPVWIQPGQATGCVTGLLGWGRRHAGETGTHVGTDLYPLRDMAGPVRIEPAGIPAVPVACTEHHATVVGAAASDVARHGTLAQFRDRPDFAAGDTEPHDTLYSRTPNAPVAWGMGIDLNACIGCNACVSACQVENNIPVVGRDEVLRQREMHWLRIERTYEGTEHAPDTFFQPMLCMHCEQAPCETVCPVGATTHDSEGLNVMVYNRCIGTKFCSNNCPYKVRRFNYFAFAEHESRPAISRNPDVSVRARGVMEKCTFCVQRIAQARITADRDGVGEHVVTACQAACPAQAISFGDLNDPAAEVTHRRASALAYTVLPEQGTRPRVTYEARILNRNPAIAS